eukprot:6197531-Pleurochrysis_carterae.AAC.1
MLCPTHQLQLPSFLVSAQTPIADFLSTRSLLASLAPTVLFSSPSPSTETLPCAFTRRLADEQRLGCRPSRIDAVPTIPPAVLL